MVLTNTEFQTILDDSSKRIEGDIVWQEDEDHSPAVEFRAEVASDAGWPIFVRGSFNPLVPALSYMMILKTMGDRVNEPILELTQDRLLLLDQDGKTKYDWRKDIPCKQPIGANS